MLKKIKLMILILISCWNFQGIALELSKNEVTNHRKNFFNTCSFYYKVDVKKFDEMLINIEKKDGSKIYQYLPFFIFECDDNNKLKKLKNILETPKDLSTKERCLKKYSLALIACRLKKFKESESLFREVCELINNFSNLNEKNHLKYILDSTKITMGFFNNGFFKIKEWELKNNIFQNINYSKYTGQLNISFKNDLNAKVEILKVSTFPKFFFYIEDKKYKKVNKAVLKNLYPSLYRVLIEYKVNDKRKFFEKEIKILKKQPTNLVISLNDFLLFFPEKVEVNKNTILSWKNLYDDKNLKLTIYIGYYKNKNSEKMHLVEVKNNIPSIQQKFLIDKWYFKSLPKDYYKGILYVKVENSKKEIIKYKYIYFDAIK
ncbi:hypothetical protein AAEX28_00135 [Lentisphaerota bacterium WC36G]|nr:hypothetical protein LJT99_03010 [Lentisphaerae bacterium WC36]